MPTLEQVLEKNPGKVKLVFKNFPIRSHKFAAKAALAVIAADMQGKFWEFHDQLFNHYNRLSDQKIKDIAKGLGLDIRQFEKQTASSVMTLRVKRDIQDGIQAGVKGTPTVFINGRRLRSRTLEGFQALIDQALEKVKKTGNGTKP